MTPIRDDVQRVSNPRIDARHRERIDVTFDILKQSGNVGYNVNQLVAGRTERIIQISGDDEQSQMVTLSLWSLGPACLAILRCGAGGANQTIFVDITRGTTVSLACSSMWVDILNGSPNNTPANISGFVGMGSVPGRDSSTPTATTMPPNGVSGYPSELLFNGNFPMLPAGNKLAVPPSYAKSVRFERVPQEAFTLDFLDETGAVILYTVTVAAGNEMQPVPLSNDAKLVKVTNSALVNITNGRLIWNLAF